MKPKLIVTILLILLFLAVLTWLARKSNLGGWFSTPTPTVTNTFMPMLTATASPTATATITPTPTPTATRTLAPLWTPTKEKKDDGDGQEDHCNPWHLGCPAPTMPPSTPGG